ncbi:MAG: Holliday junction branch migration protein RuvA [Ruminococcaceae bacterium]|nr:Holliday junction branch migration protein RuvA [Oscillospiraceae bacterium]
MFYYLNGEIALIDENIAVVDCGGVGYACHSTTYTLSKLRVGQKAKLYTHCNIREDAFDIFGFSSREELRCFQMLLGVTGVGPKAAQAILSAVSPERFTLAVMTQDEKALIAAQGVGKKLAQRIILELKDKLGSVVTEVDFSGNTAAPIPQSGSNLTLAQAALAELGYSHAEITAALKGVPIDGMTTEQIVKQCLRAMVMR